MNYSEYRRRRRLAVRLESTDVSISLSDGFAQADLASHEYMRKCVEYCRELAKVNDLPGMSSSAKKSFLVTHRIDLADARHKAILDLATHPDLISPVSKYLGLVPVLGGAAIWYSPNVEFEKGRSQMYHLDGEDFRQVKCFVALDDVTMDSGPLTVIAASESRRIYDSLRRSKSTDRRNRKFSDQVIHGQGQPTKGIPMIGPSGSIALVDTCSCYHFGSRPGSSPRLVLMLHFFSPFSVEMPFFVYRYRSLELAESSGGEFGAEIRRCLLGLSHLNINLAPS